ncbi:threonine/serine ThrE exporter family protein [Testudinibacter sp. TR-2022]|uniref:threonine/serine ThrE exporter family protein n=1 Tax=Testudinibacter sp. TR-2022 TaxID=2585029 RepID=UPI001117DCAF|nr:threonine/serine exporter ThrE family protein [Testudinibacter sp. TR-2022]TNH04330.1 threonine/serine exporter family protein [Pasteurellaceae bacterium Phil11]TNH23097.1 threonine/serine exporter family protein [Testudinibacter sp. TR-2022]TNH25025.1 threonine/serine exporter family protein [Testudinibacter sp. TR-2022]
MSINVTAPDHSEQQEITRLCVHTALLLLQHGAESTLVSQIAARLGKALGVESVEVALTANAIVLTTLHQGHCITTARRNQDRGINMHVVTEVQHIVIAAEHKIYDSYTVRKKLQAIKPLKYNRYYVLLMVGLSCASFAHLAGGDALICLITFLAACAAMLVRQELAMRHYNPIIVFACTAFVATCISGLSLRFHLGNDSQIAIASSVLLLVPGFPFINALSDILKGYTNMGIGRWALATVLTFGACIGIVFALSLLNIQQWGG